ncbi:transposase [Coraliomargarita sp. W4R53]
MYDWRKMCEAERQAVFSQRQLRGGSWRRPPVWNLGGTRYMITAACFEHVSYIGNSIERISGFETSLLTEIDPYVSCIYAHAILPNHYHVLLETNDIGKLRIELGKFHGRTSFNWNKEDGTQGRKVFHGSAETAMKSERHFQATLNYIHNNPVKHGYVDKWQDWPYSSAAQYLAAVGKEEAAQHWLEYPIDRYGEDWDA